MFVLPLPEPATAAAIAARLAHLPGLAWLDGDGVHRDGRYSFVTAAPCERIAAPFDARAPLALFDRLEPVAGPERVDAPLDCTLVAEDVPRFIGYVAYDACLASMRMRLPRTRKQPLLEFARYDALFAFDQLRGQSFVVGDDRAACDRLLARLACQPRAAQRLRCGAISAPPPEQHRAAIARAFEHIAQGDVYQVNLARCFQAPFEGDALALFGAMRTHSPVPFGFYFDTGDRQLLVRTMERFLAWNRGTRALITRPIKGTIARHGGRDHAEAAALCADEKERAEHVMIVDLMRNDLGRVAEIGSVRVPQQLGVEPFAGLSHLVSTVACRTRPGTSLRQVLDATFPPGSVTGAPKLRAIELIEQLEAVPRGVYTGAVGFVDRAGGLSLAVAIRSAVVEAGSAHYFAGGGIVEASRVEHELAETELKARVFTDALASLGVS